MELRQLRYFIAVAEERHFGRAAERLHIAQPGLSQAIQALERSVGARLIDREVRPIALTPAGEALLPQARKVMEAADRARQAAAVPAAKARRLDVGTPLLGVLPRVIELEERFRSRYPAVELRAHPALTPQSLERLARGEIDVAIVHAPFEPVKKPHFLPLGQQEMVVLIPEGHRMASLERIPREALRRERFLHWPTSVNPPLIAHLHRMLFGTTQPPNGIEVSIGIDALSRAQLVAAGRGLTAEPLPRPIERFPERPGVVYRRLEDPPVLLEYGLAWFDHHDHSLVESFVSLATEMMEGSSTEPADSSERSPSPRPSDSLLTHT